MESILAVPCIGRINAAGRNFGSMPADDTGASAADAHTSAPVPVRTAAFDDTGSAGPASHGFATEPPAKEREQDVPSADAADDDRRLAPGGPGYRRMSFALFLAGMATFALLYSTQALLPLVSSGFGTSASAASWTVSAATGALALCVLPLSALSERYGRRTVMTGSLAVAVLVGLLVPFAPSIGALVALRAVQGAALAGLPASAMAYLAEEVRPRALVAAVGLFVAGNSIGGMSGRIISGWIAQAWGWRVAVGTIGVLAVLCAVAFRALLPAPRYGMPRHGGAGAGENGGRAYGKPGAGGATGTFGAADTAPEGAGAADTGPKGAGAAPAAGARADGRGALVRTVRAHLANPLLRRLYAIGALFMGVFGASYTVIGYRLTDAPYSLPQGLVGSVFLVYLVGTASSATAGRLVTRLGRRGALYLAAGTTAAGLLLSLAGPLALVLLGLVLITAGFFAGHAVASSAVSRTATHGRAQASALYQSGYYIGSSVGSTLGALAFRTGGWGGTVALGLLAVTGVVVITLYGTRAAARAAAGEDDRGPDLRAADAQDARAGDGSVAAAGAGPARRDEGSGSGPGEGARTRCAVVPGPRRSTDRDTRSPSTTRT
jgi:YNFM family putative membrane transporter